MKINQQHYLEVKQSSFITTCSFYINDITSKNDLISCGIEGILYKLCLRRQCHYFVNNVNYCNNCVIVNKCTDKDNTECVFEEDCNDECVTVFDNNVVDDDVQSVDNTLISFGDNTVFNGLPDYNVVEDFESHILDT